jgi:hypothetical protein
MISKKVLKYMIEALLGVAVACLIVLVLALTVGTVPFVYQGY